MRIAVSCVAFLMTTWASAGMLPHFSVIEMCDRAEVIVEGEWLDGERMRVDRVYKGSTDVAVGEIIWVQTLDEHVRVVGGWWKDDPAELASSALVAFLKRGEGPGAWRPMGTHSNRGIRRGSTGVIWFDDQQVYRYFQFMNPGPYWLVPAMGYRLETHTPEELRAEIARGLALHQEWECRAAIEDPSARAKALGDYLVEARSPAGCDFHYVQKAGLTLGEMGASAVPALMDVLGNATCQYGDHNAIGALARIGSEAKPVVPLLCELLEWSTGELNTTALRALGAIGDLSAAPHVRVWLEPERLSGLKAWEITEVVQCLCAVGDHESFDDMVRAVRSVLAMIPLVEDVPPPFPGFQEGSFSREDISRWAEANEAVNTHNCLRSNVADMIRAMHKLDPERTAPIIRTLINDPRMEWARRRLEGLLDEE